MKNDALPAVPAERHVCRHRITGRTTPGIEVVVEVVRRTGTRRHRLPDFVLSTPLCRSRIEGPGPTTLGRCGFGRDACVQIPGRRGK